MKNQLVLSICWLLLSVAMAGADAGSVSQPAAADVPGAQRNQVPAMIPDAAGTSQTTGQQAQPVAGSSGLVIEIDGTAREPSGSPSLADGQEVPGDADAAGVVMEGDGENSEGVVFEDSGESSEGYIMEEGADSADNAGGMIIEESDVVPQAEK